MSMVRSSVIGNYLVEGKDNKRRRGAALVIKSGTSGVSGWIKDWGGGTVQRRGVTSSAV